MAAAIGSLFSPLLPNKLRLSPSPNPRRPNPRVRVRFPIRSSLQSDLADASVGFDSVAELELRRKGFMGLRKTKLVCTVGPPCCSDEELERLAMGGMNVARLNMCHNTREWHRGVIRAVKRLNREKGFCISVMVDTEGCQMHVIDHGSDSSIKAEEDSLWLFTTEKFKGPRPFTVQVNFEGFSEGIMVGDELVVDGGMATFEVIEKVGSDLHCKCIDPGLLLRRAKLSFWRNGELVGTNSGFPTLSTKDWADIEFGISEGVDFIALSFIKDASDIKHLKSYLSRRSAGFIKVLAKIESMESLKNLEDIIEASDAVMVARGDLGVHIPLEEIPAIQEEITRICRQLNKPVIVASQLLESMIVYPTPTRAEVADVSEAVRQFADALMLSGESAAGSFAEKALAVLRMASGRMELSGRQENCQSFLVQRQLAVSLPDHISEQICIGAVEMANSLGVDAIFVFTKHGYMASLLSGNRPNPPIFAFTDHPGVRKSMNLLWGVIPIELPLSEDIDANIKETINIMKNRGLVKYGDVVLVVSELGRPSAAPSVFQSIHVKNIV